MRVRWEDWRKDLRATAGYAVGALVVLGIMYAVGMDPDLIFRSVPAFGALCLLGAWLLRRRERRRTANAAPPAPSPPDRPNGWRGAGGGTLTRKSDGTTFWKRR